MGTVFGFNFGPRFGSQFWALLIRNKRHAPNSVPILVPVLGPVLGSILGPILGTNLEHFCLLGCWLLKLVVLEHLAKATFLCQRLFLHRLFEGKGGEFRSKFFIVVVASMLCLAKPCRYLGGTPMWSEVSCCFWAPIWGLEIDMLGDFHSYIRVIFWLPHV